MHKSWKSCAECQIKIKSKHESYKNSTIEQYQQMPSVQNKPRHWINVHIRMFNRNWNKKLYNNPCQNCNYDKHVELAHIKDIADFPVTTLIREVNDPINILVLCPNCHWEFDYGDLKLESIKSRNT
jgi:predicted restriction endonuclease